MSLRQSFLTKRYSNWGEASVSESHLGSSTRRQSVYIYIVASFPGSPLTRNYCVTFELVLFLHEFKGHAIIARKGGSLGTRLYISYVRHFWSRGPRATRKRKPAHLKFKGHTHAYVANASRAITTLIERLYTCTAAL